MNLILYRIINLLFEAITLVIFVDVIASWLPMLRLNVPRWAADILAAVHRIADVFLAPIRRLIPGIGGLDISPIIALILLDVLRRLLVSVLF